MGPSTSKAPPTHSLDDNGPPLSRCSSITCNSAPRYAGPGQLEGSRTAILRDLGPCIYELAFEFFKQYILPRIPKRINLKAVLSKLRKRKIIVGGRWAAFPHDPFEHAGDSVAAEKLKEKEVFAKLATIIDAIQKCVSDYKRPPRATTEYESNPDSPPVCCFDKKDGKPDGYFVFTGRQSLLDDRRRLWRDIATTAEFKLCDTRENLADVSIVFAICAETEY